MQLYSFAHPSFENASNLNAKVVLLLQKKKRKHINSNFHDFLIFSPVLFILEGHMQLGTILIAAVWCLTGNQCPTPCASYHSQAAHWYRCRWIRKYRNMPAAQASMMTAATAPFSDNLLAEWGVRTLLALTADDSHMISKMSVVWHSYGTNYNATSQ